MTEHTCYRCGSEIELQDTKEIEREGDDWENYWVRDFKCPECGQESTR